MRVGTRMGTIGKVAMAAALALGSVVVAAPVPVGAVGEPLSGIVTDTAGDPLAGVYVSLTGGMGGGSAVTAADGSYAILSLDGSYQLSFTKSGYRSETYPDLAWPPSGMPPPGTPVTITNGAPIVINESLKRLPRLTGQVVDRSGNPIAASVNSALLPYGAGGNTLADAGGAFTIDLPQDGTHRLSAFAAGFLTTYAPSTIDSNAASSWTVTYDQVIPVGQLTLLRGGTISGNVGSGTGPIPGATVNAYPTPYLPASGMATADANGDYSITGLPEGTYQVNFSAPGYLSEKYDDLPSNSPTSTLVAVTEGQATTGVDALLAAGATVTGRVLDHLGNPVAGAGVQAWLQGQPGFSASGSTMTDANGDYTIGGLAVGQYLVTAGKAGWAQVFLTGTSAPTAGDVLTLAAGSTTTANFSLQLPGTLTGLLLDPGGQPIVGGTVSATSVGTPGLNWFPMFFNQLSKSTTTDASGVFNITDLAPAAFRVNGSAGVQNGPLAYEYFQDAYSEAAATPVSVPTGAATAPVIISLDVGGTVSGHVTDADGAPLAGAWVTLMGPNGEYGGSVAADANGDYTIRGATPGIYTAATGSPLTYHPGTNTRAEATEFTVALGDVVTGIDVQLPRTTRLEATILDSSGQPIPLVNPYAFWGISVCNAPATPVATMAICSAGTGSTLAGTRHAAGQTTIDGFPTGTFNIAAAVAFPVAISAPVALTMTPGDLAVCTFQIGGTGSCTVTGNNPEPDDDGVPAAVEDAAPNGGDGNGDAVPDSEQTNVTSLPSPVPGGGYVTVAAPAGVELSSVTVVDPAAVTATPPPGATVDNGVIAYTLNGVTPGATVDVDVFLSTPTTADGYAKVQGGQWVPLPATAFDKISDTHFVLHLTDGGDGDEDGQANGTIIDPGAPISLDTTAPTITCPAAPTFVLNALGASVTAQVTDSGAGVATATATATADTTVFGDRTVTLAATDLAGNTATVPCAYTVGVRIVHLEVDGDDHRRIDLDAGDTVKVRWRTVDAMGRPVATPSTIALRTAATTCGAHPTVIGPETDASLNGAGVRYKGSGYWEAKWRTDRSWRGCRQLTVSAVGDTDTAALRFRRD